MEIISWVFTILYLIVLSITLVVNDVAGLSGSLAADLKPYRTLSYANGPGYDTNFNGGVRPDLTNVDTSKPNRY